MDESSESDAELVEAARTNTAAFSELYERYYARVYRYIVHRVGNAPDAEDITAVVFMKALEALPSYRHHSNGFAPWLFRIARNAVVDHYRRGKRTSPLEAIETVSSGDDPMADALQAERRSELHELISGLSPEQREVILLRYASDLTYAEIAAALDKNEPAVRMLVHRGLRKLKAVLTDG
jgi:RNA polymerase sigma-70 factor (ECF subfamily)